MPRRKQAAPKRLKGTPQTSATGEVDGIHEAGDDAGDRTEDEKDEKEDDEGENENEKDGLNMLESPTASWSVKFTPYGSTTEKVMGTSITAGTCATSKVFSKGTWYPDDSSGMIEHGSLLGESSQSEDEQDKSHRKNDVSLKMERKVKVKDIGKVEHKHEKKVEGKVNSASTNTQRELSEQQQPVKHSASSLVRENLRHFFLDKLKSSGKLTSGEKNKKRKLSNEEEHLEAGQSASTSNHQSRNSYTHTVLWMPPKTDKRSDSSSHKTCNSDKLSKENEANEVDDVKCSNSVSSIANTEERIGPASKSQSNSSIKDCSQSRREREKPRSSSSQASFPENTSKSKLNNEDSHDASFSRSLSPSDYYHSHSAGMAYYPAPFMGYGLYPSYPNFVYPYNYGYVVAVPGGLFIPMGHSSYAPSSGTGLSSSQAPHKDVPLDLSSCSTTKKEEEVIPKVIKKEEPSSSSASSSSSVSTSSSSLSGRHPEEKGEASSPKKKGEKTIVLWKKVPRHAMMMDMAQLSVLEKVHVLYTTESTFLCFICSDCHALFNSLDLLALHAVGTAHSSRSDIDVKAMGLKGFEVIPMDKIAKKQKHVDKKPDFSFESPLQSTVSLHRRRLPGSKDYVMKNRDVYKCSVCPDTFPNFLWYTMHMNETGHRRKSVRYSDVYKAQKQVKKILKCMNCEKSFMTLEELTMHMIKTKHYSDIAGGFANQTELDEDGDFDHQLGHDDNQFESTEPPSMMDPLISSVVKSSQMDNTMDGTSSDSESPHSFRTSPLDQWRCSTRLESNKGENRDHTREAEGGSKEMKDILQQSSSKVDSASSDHNSQTGAYAGTSQSSLPTSQTTKRDLRYLGDDAMNYDSLSKRIKVEAESAAEEEDDDDNMTFGGYESENEYEEEEEDEMDSLDPEYSLRLFHPAHSTERGVDNSFSIPSSEMGRRKYRTRIYKHSLLYQSKQNGSDTKQDVSAFDGLYNWAKSLGLLSSPTVALSAKTAQAPKAVVKCDGKYVDPDNFDVTLPYGGKVHPDVNPLRKLSSMVETTQIKQPQNKSFESNFIMDRAYFNFEKTQGNSAQTSLIINSNSQSDDQDSHTNFAEDWERSYQQEQLSNPSHHFEVDSKDKLIENSKGTLSFPSAEKRAWLIDRTISKDAVLERLILKAYNRPSKSGYRISTNTDQTCTCSTEPEIGFTTRDSETRPSKVGNRNIHDEPKAASAAMENEPKEKRHQGKQKALCKKCSSSSHSDTKTKRISCHPDAQENDKCDATQVRLQSEEEVHAKVKEVRELEHASGSKKNMLEQRDQKQLKTTQSTASFLSRVGVGREHLQGLIYGHRDAVREVKFTWADAIDTLISRSFGSEDDPPPDQHSAQTLPNLKKEEVEKENICASREPDRLQEFEEGSVCKENRVPPEHCKSNTSVTNEPHGHSSKSDIGTLQSKSKYSDGDGMSDGSLSCENEQDGKTTWDTHKVGEENGKVPESQSCDQNLTSDYLKDERTSVEDGLNRHDSDLFNPSDKDFKSKETHCTVKLEDGHSPNKCDIGKGSSGTPVSEERAESLSGSPEKSPIQTCNFFDVKNKLAGTEDSKQVPRERGNNSVEMSPMRSQSRSSSLSLDGSPTEPGKYCAEACDSYKENLHFSPTEAVEQLPKTSTQFTVGKGRGGWASGSLCEEREDGHAMVASQSNREIVTKQGEVVEGPGEVKSHSDLDGRSFIGSKKAVNKVADNSEERSRKSPSLKDGHARQTASLSDRTSKVTSHRPIRYFSCGSPPPLIPSVDASTKAIRRLEELTRKPAVTNVKEMILNKIQEEVERLIGPGSEDRKVPSQLQSGLPYLFPRAENNNDVDSSKKSLNSLVELSKCAPLPPFKRIQSDFRMSNEGSLAGRRDPSMKYLLPSTTPESSVSAIQSLEKLSTEHPVLRRNESTRAMSASPLQQTSSSAEKVQYLPPSFGREASNANTIQSLERFSSQNAFFGYCLDKPHSKPTSDYGIGLSERLARHTKEKNPHSSRSSQNGLVSKIGSPLVVSLPKLEPLSPVESRQEENEDHSTRPKLKSEDHESADLEDAQTKESSNHRETDDASPRPLAPVSAEDPLLALDNLVRKKQGMDVSPSPSKVAWELVNKDMKPPLYILQPDNPKGQVDKNPLEEMDKMLKFS